MTTNPLDPIQARFERADKAQDAYGEDTGSALRALTRSIQSTGDVPKLIAALRAVEAVLSNWEADGEVDIAISKTIPHGDAGTQLLINGADKIENARIIRQVIRESLG